MSSLRRRFGISLSGQRVGNALVPWDRLNGTVARLKPTAVARLLDPRLPPTVRGLWPLGTQTIDRLRIRAIRRAIAAGTYERFWLAGPRASLTRLAAVTAITALLVLGAAWLWLRHIRAVYLPTGHAEFD